MLEGDKPRGHLNGGMRPDAHKIWVQAQLLGGKRKAKDSRVLESPGELFQDHCMRRDLAVASEKARWRCTKHRGRSHYQAHHGRSP